MSASPSPQARVQGPAAAVVGRLVIPALKLDAPIVPVGLAKDGTMGVTAGAFEAGWYERGPFPGAAGDAVIDGHLTWYGAPQAIFWNLKQMKPGDTIQVNKAGGSNRRFTVESVQTYPYTAQPAGLFATGGPPHLSLITCGGTWNPKTDNYPDRVVVTAKLVA